MKRFAVISGICISLLLAAAFWAAAQEERKAERQSAAPPDRQDQAPPADRQNAERQNQNRDRPNAEKPAEDRQGQEQPTQEQPSRNRQRQDQPGVERQSQERQNPPRQGEMPPGDNGQNKGRRIPDADFRAHFGREHRFAPGRMAVYQGRPRFFYSGYTFELLDPWPSDWSYEQDDCYVDYVDDGYWLYNDRYPAERVAVMIVG